VAYLFFECAVCEIGAEELEEVSDVEAVGGCDRAALGGAKMVVS
jgi:hypothetical protein